MSAAKLIGLFERLTPRQREVLQLVAEGNTTKEIGSKLNLSVKTVEMHRTQLMATLDIHDIAGLVRMPSEWESSRLISHAMPRYSSLLCPRAAFPCRNAGALDAYHRVLPGATISSKPK